MGVGREEQKQKGWISMFTRIVVPLDGTHFAEAALAPARELARAFGARLLLVRALAPGARSTATDTPAPATDVQAVSEIDAYLRRILGKLRGEGFEVEATLQVAEPGRGIVQATELATDDIIVMSSHVRWQLAMHGEASTTLDVLGKARTPILVWRVRPSYELEGMERDGAQFPLLGRNEFPLIVTLDGSAFAERALPYAEALAHAFGQYLVLTRVVRPNEPEDAAFEYLYRKVAEVIGRGVPAVASVRRGDPMGEIEKIWRERDGSLIVMASRGATMTSSGILGSLAARLIEEIEAPLLVVRPQLALTEHDAPMALETTTHNA